MLKILSVLRHTTKGSASTTAVNPLLMVIFIAIAIAIFVLYIFLLQYIYKDAVKRELKAELWLIAVLIAPIPAIIVYFIVRKAKERS